MDEKRIHDKLDRMESTLVKQEINLARLTTSVEEHVKRSNLLEAALQPIEKHVAMVQGAVKLISILGVLAAIVALFLGR